MKNGAMRRAGLVLALALLVVGVSAPAMGTGNGYEEPAFKIKAFSPECGEVYAKIKINNTGFPGFLSGVYGSESPLLNDHPWAGIAFKVDQLGSLSHEFAEDENGGSVTVTIFAHGPEQDTYAVGGRSPAFKTIEVITDCEEEPEPTTSTTVPEEPSTTLPINPEIPTLINTDACGGSDQVYLPDDSAEVTYLVDGEASGPRVLTHNVPGESRDVVITAVAADGSVLATYEFTIDRQEDCPEVSSTVVTLPGEGSGSSTPELTELPFTGSEDLPLVFVAAGLLALGGLVLAASRKGRLDG